MESLYPTSLQQYLAFQDEYAIESQHLWNCPALTDTEKEIIYLHYNLQYSIAEIAHIKSVSRQAINKSKSKALVKLKKFINCE